MPGNQGEGKWCSPLSSALAGPFPRSEGGRETRECTYRIDRRHRRRQRRVSGALLGDESQWRKVNSLPLFVQSRRVARAPPNFARCHFPPTQKPMEQRRERFSGPSFINISPIIYDMQRHNWLQLPLSYIEQQNFNIVIHMLSITRFDQILIFAVLSLAYLL